MKKLSKICAFIADIFMPQRCPCCSKIIQWNHLICNECLSKLENLKISDFIQNNDTEKFQKVYCCFDYKSPAKQGIYSLKDGYGKNFALFSSDIIANKILSDNINFDIITCVPMAHNKKISRGYNQAEIFAEYLSAKIKTPCDFSLLKRSSQKRELHSLNQHDRYLFADKVYSVNKKHNNINGKNILLCDDVLTTGATLNKCFSLLKSINADKIYVAVICSVNNENDNN